MLFSHPPKNCGRRFCATLSFGTETFGLSVYIRMTTSSLVDYQYDVHYCGMMNAYIDCAGFVNHQ
jgi:hypothetical protein